MSVLAIIPARGGSKRIPRKNIKNFLGKPIIAYPIETALNSGLFNEVMVSTEDEEIRNIAIGYGAKVPFMRSAKNADDMAGTEEVIVEVLQNYQKKGNTFRYVCCIYPATPLLTTNLLITAKDKLVDNAFDTVFPVMKYGHPVQRALKNVSGTIRSVWPEHADSRSQDLETYYHDAGQFYWLDVEKFQKHSRLFSQNSGFIELADTEAQDIDNLDDWAIAELKFKMKHPGDEH